MKIILIAFMLLLAGCTRYPTSDFECRIEASKAPTGYGVSATNKACDEKFKDEIAARKLASDIVVREKLDEIISTAQAPTWAEVEAKPEFQRLNDEDKAYTKKAYFDHWVAPHVGGERDALFEQFMAPAKKK
ncbi:hypothetical protein [Herminiimonas sp. CN]|uniref:hypothetical protein n=1 Tax=Herminiimonas sp. CN TaxID=1349818 RepID=UPI0004735F6C|nr:hypothetical protein [Herminiimonas sp. CN]